LFVARSRRITSWEKNVGPHVDKDDQSKRSARLAFLGIIAWLSVCLIVVGLFPQSTFSLQRIWLVAGLFGLASAVGLSQAVKLELRRHKEVLNNYIAEARTDALTGLGNRRAFDAELQHMQRVWRRGIPVSLLLLDIDHFKDFNDKFGHQAGDEMLRSVAETLQNEVDGIGLAMRYGGEELAVILRDTDLEEATTIAESLRIVIAGHHFGFRGCDLNVTVSVGVAQAELPDTTSDLVVRADTRLYFAKSAGRNCTRAADDQPAKPTPVETPLHAGEDIAGP
jgi:diguanylate cyclase (GGDEF)-like protein